MQQRKRLLKRFVVVGLSVASLSAGIYYLSDSNHRLNPVLAESSDSGYSNAMNFKARSKILESSTVTSKPTVLDIVLDFSSSYRYKIFDSIDQAEMLINEALTNENSKVIVQVYNYNNTTSYGVQNGDTVGYSTTLLTKQEALSILAKLKELAKRQPSLGGSNALGYDTYFAAIGQTFGDKNYTDPTSATPIIPFEDVVRKFITPTDIVSVIQFTDGWNGGASANGVTAPVENIDFTFAEWAKSRAKTFMSVINRNVTKASEGDSDQDANSEQSIRDMTRVGHPNIYDMTGKDKATINRELLAKFKETAIVTTNTTTSTKQQGHVTITPDTDLKLTSTELVKPDGSKINLPITNNRVDWTGQLDDGSYKLNYTFSGKPSVERSIRGIVTVDDQKVDEKVNTVKPETAQFETRYENDPSLASGVEKEKQPGVQGLRYVITRDGNVVSTINERQKQDRIVLRGTKGSDREVTTQKIPFETKCVDDPDLKAGETKVLTKGVEGEKEITKTYTTQSGSRVGDPAVSERIVTDKVDEVIARGTRDSDIETLDSDIPFKVIYQEDKTLEHGTQRVDVEGAVGKLKTTKTYITQSGKRVGEPTVINEIVTTKVDKVISVGTKPVVTTKEIDFKTKYVEDKELEAKKQETKTEGKKGSETTTQTYSFNSETGEVTDNEPKVETVAAVDKVISVGTKPVVTTKEIAFKTERCENKKMKKGEEKVVQEGVAGLETTTQSYSFNSETGEVADDEPKVEMKEAVNKIIEYGTREDKKLPKTGGHRLAWLSFSGLGLVIGDLAFLVRKLIKK